MNIEDKVGCQIGIRQHNNKGNRNWVMSGLGSQCAIGKQLGNTGVTGNFEMFLHRRNGTKTPNNNLRKGYRLFLYVKGCRGQLILIPGRGMDYLFDPATVVVGGLAGSIDCFILHKAIVSIWGR